ARRGAVTVVARENYFLYYPFLRDLVAGAADLTEVAFPLREVLDPRVRLVVGDLARVDAQGREARVRLPDGEERALRYDHLVIALGSSTAYHGVPGARESAVAFKSVDDALALRLRVLDALESEESGGRLSPDVVVAGGSYAGLEVAGALHDLLRRAHRVYGPALRARPPVIHVVEGERRLLGGMPDPIPEYVQALLRRRGGGARRRAPPGRAAHPGGRDGVGGGRGGEPRGECAPLPAREGGAPARRPHAARRGGRLGAGRLRGRARRREGGAHDGAARRGGGGERRVQPRARSAGAPALAIPPPHARAHRAAGRRARRRAGGARPRAPGPVGRPALARVPPLA